MLHCRWLHRQYAYASAGLSAKGVRSHPRYVPRTVTILRLQATDGRYVWNMDEVRAGALRKGVEEGLRLGRCVEHG